MWRSINTVVSVYEAIAGFLDPASYDQLVATDRRFEATIPANKPSLLDIVEIYISTEDNILRCGSYELFLLSVIMIIEDWSLDKKTLCDLPLLPDPEGGPDREVELFPIVWDPNHHPNELGVLHPVLLRDNFEAQWAAAQEWRFENRRGTQS